MLLVGYETRLNVLAMVYHVSPSIGHDPEGPQRGCWRCTKGDPPDLGDITLGDWDYIGLEVAEQVHAYMAEHGLYTEHLLKRVKERAPYVKKCRWRKCLTPVGKGRTHCVRHEGRVSRAASR